MGRTAPRRYDAIALLAGLLLMLGCTARAQAWAATVAAAGPNGSITGTVLDAVSEKPISGVEVCAPRAEASEEEASNEEPPCVLTGAEGTYSLSLPPDRYVVVFSAPFESPLNYLTVFYPNATTFEAATPVTVAPGGHLAEIDARMHEGGRIAGVVTDAVSGAALSGVLVCAQPLSEAAGGFNCGSTGASGAYTVSALTTGEYRVVFVPLRDGSPEYAPQFYLRTVDPSAARPVHVTAGATTEAIVARLARAGRIEGRITAAPGRGPLADAIVCALIPGAEPLRASECTITGAGGEYVLKHLPPGSFDVVFVHPGFQMQFYDGETSIAKARAVTVSEGSVVPQIDAELQPTGSTATSKGSAPQLPGLGSAGGLGGGERAAVLRILSRKGRAGRRTMNVRAACTVAPCRGTIALLVRVHRRSRVHGRWVSTARAVVLARGSFSVPAGAHWVQRLHLTAAGTARLARVARRHLHALLTVRLAGRVAGSYSIDVT